MSRNCRPSPLARRLLVHLTVVLGLLGSAAGQTRPAPPSPFRFVLVYTPRIADSFTGRVYVMLSSNERREPRFGPAWFGTEPFFAVDVVDWKPGIPMVIDDSASGFPGPLSELEPKTYSIQAVMRRNLESPSIGRGHGNAYSPVLRSEIGPDTRELRLLVNKVHREQDFRQSDRIKFIHHHSKLLSEFHGRPVFMRATVILPQRYDEYPNVRYPTFYWIGGFGSTHRSAWRMNGVWDQTSYADRIARVVLDPSCYGGHHVFADSDNNGPRGEALVTELIPYLQEKFRLVAAPTARFVSGHSSGGWSSLWLQVAYPDFFGGVWSLAPDPVDFTHFQTLNIYQPGANAYRDPEGNERPVARRGRQAFAWYEPFTRMELVVGDGGQLGSFDWVFGPRGPDGRPLRLYDPETGLIDPEVAEAWKRYDIRLILENNWETLGPKLAGKIHIIVGDLDTFYLDGAVKSLKESLERLGSDAQIEIIPGADHGSIATRAVRRQVDEQLMQLFERYHDPLPVGLEDDEEMGD